MTEEEDRVTRAEQGSGEGRAVGEEQEPEEGRATDEKQAPEDGGTAAGRKDSGEEAEDVSERAEGGQHAIIHEGAAADRAYDTNEGADEKVQIVEPDGTPSPRAPSS